MSYPILNFKAKIEEDSTTMLNWFPSEYLYREKTNEYCMAIETFSRNNEILLGGTFMR
jgi:hypothetical protein